MNEFEGFGELYHHLHEEGWGGGLAENCSGQGHGRMWRSGIGDGHGWTDGKGIGVEDDTGES